MATYPMKFLKDRNGNGVLPITALKAVRDENNTPLDEIIENLEIEAGSIQPDNEDLQLVDSKLKFKDRPNTDGMGRVILRKNIVSGVNTLTQSMINQQNTIYVIQYDFVLGEDITIPANCVLEFDGGSISGNGTGKDTITGTNTGINASLVKIFNTDVTLGGSWNVVEAYPEWFGAVGDGVADDSDAVQCSFKFKKVRAKNVYKISKTINVLSENIYGGGEFNFVSDEYVFKFLDFIGQNDIHIKDISFNGNNKVSTCIYVYDEQTIRDSIIIDNVIIKNLYGYDKSAYGIHIQDKVNTISITNCSIENVYTTNIGEASTNGGIAMSHLNGPCYIANNTLRNIITAKTQDSDAVKVFSENNASDDTDLTVTHIINNVMFNSNGRFVKLQCTNAIIEGNTFEIDSVTLINEPCCIGLQRGGAIVSNNNFYIKSATVTNSKLIIVKQENDNSVLSAHQNINTVIENNTVHSDINLNSLLNANFQKLDKDTSIVIKNNELDLPDANVVRFTASNITKQLAIYFENNTIVRSNQIFYFGGDLINRSDSTIMATVAEKVSWILKNNVVKSDNIKEAYYKGNTTLLASLPFYKIQIEGNINVNEAVYGCGWNLANLGNTKCFFDTDGLNTDGKIAGVPASITNYGSLVYIEGILKSPRTGGYYSIVRLSKRNLSSDSEFNYPVTIQVNS